MPKIDKEKRMKEKLPLPKGVIRVNETLCGGCKICMYACSLTNEGMAAIDLSRIQISSNDIDQFDTFAEPCLQCADPQCYRYCPTGALKIDENTHARIIDRELCIGCKLCIKHCPYTLPRIRFDAVAKKAVKCNLCGGNPQCVKLCPTGALTYETNPEGIANGYGAGEEEKE